MKVLYYLSPRGENPVRDFVDALEAPDRSKTERLFQSIQTYGLQAVLPHIKKLTGTPLWEIRILGKTGVRIFYVTLENDTALMLHGFVKKTQKTPSKEILLAVKRLDNYKLRLNAT